MFSPRLLAIFALVAAAAAIPASDRPVPDPITTITEEDIETPWFSFPLFGNFFAPLWQLFPKFNDIGPKIISDDDKFEIIVNVNGYNKDDLKVKIKGDFIFIQGSQEAKQDDHDVFASHFFHTYTLPANFSSSSITASYTSDSYLIVKALFDAAADETKDVDREVTIVSTGKPYKEETPTEEKPEEEKPTEEKTTEEEKPAEEEKPVEEVKPVLSDIETPVDVKPLVEQAKPEVAPTPTPEAATTAASEDDRKEPTTPAQEEDATEKDNVIPHGNEIQP